MKKRVMNIACAIALLSGLAVFGGPGHAFAASAAQEAVCSWETVYYSWGYQTWKVCDTVTTDMVTLDANVETTYELIGTFHYA